jgi:hypothetical protein
MQTNYLSLAGYLRLKKFTATGIWEKNLYDFTPLVLSIGGVGGDPSLGEYSAWTTFQEALSEYPNRVVFIIQWTCQVPEPGEGPMRDWHFDIRANRFRDAWPNGHLRRNTTIKIKEQNLN